MRSIGRAVAFALTFALCACHRAGPLPPGATLGAFADTEQPESYTGATLYTYMDGGADFYINQGFSALYVRRYSRGNEHFTVELFEMNDAPGASRVYQTSRRPNEEKPLAGFCLASVSPAEIQAARGRYYLVGRNDDALTTRGDALLELSQSVLNRLPGACSLAAKK